jgi:uncharacterized SAM-binding protein YcdF (DUF218 family)
MDIIWHKVLPVFLLPLGITTLLVVWGLLRRRLVWAWLGLAWLWLASTRLVGDAAIEWVEGNVQRVAPAQAPTAQAIVVLGEGRVVAPGAAAISESTDGDRFEAGVALYQAKRAPVLVFTGGWVPWLPLHAPEGETLMQLAIQRGIPASAMRTTDKVSNTEAEAQAVAQILPPKARVLLVTSAYHMPRAQQQFERAGFVVQPYPVDFQSNRDRVFSWQDVLPQAIYLRRTETAMRELLGRAFYAVRGLFSAG